MRIRFIIAILLLCLALFSLSLPCLASEDPPVPPEEPGVLQRFGERLNQVWHSSSYDLYVPLYTWHNRFMYDDEHINRYNENPWGLGLGKSIFDEDGDSHLLYAMGFMDSNNYFEPIVGYAFLKNWYPDGNRDGWRLGAGFTLSVTGRHEYSYIPLPLPLPVVGVGYGRFDIQATYIPGTYNDGNVLFACVRWRFGK